MTSTSTRRLRFGGRIAGVGGGSGIRAVVGNWTETPFGPFADAMVETAAGHRVLLAPTRQVADLLEGTYTFDEVRVEDFDLTTVPEGWQVRAPSLRLDLRFGARTPIGRALRCVPAAVARSPAWCTVTDPVARVLMDGVRTRGTAGNGRREWYAATDAHRIIGARGLFDGTDLGELAQVSPPTRFGFSAPPRNPTVTTVVTTIEMP